MRPNARSPATNQRTPDPMSEAATAAPIPGAIAAAGDSAGAAWEEFIDDDSISWDTSAAYRKAAEQFLRRLDASGVPLPQVTHSVVADYLNRPGLKPSTQGFYRAALRRFFARMVGHRVLPTNPLSEARSRRAAHRPLHKNPHPAHQHRQRAAPPAPPVWGARGNCTRSAGGHA